ncbi:pantetheine-phosphate adenylyltransferase [Planctomicrobium sp. SH668]|uniref:pantetheine-phosphate adenylyltransferase n=1 Tax=Planctomicrobium sp. SH668 TaxID=3448126 RepID=UPI003F5AE755
MSEKKQERIAIYAGSFDPFTLGHEDIVRRGAQLFDKVVVGVGINPDKKPLFSAAEREESMRASLVDVPNVIIDHFSGLTVDFADSHGATVMIRGVRTVSDIEAEFTMALANHMMAPHLETVFLMAAEKFSHISSTLIKQIAFMGKETTHSQLEKFVPRSVIAPLMKKVEERNQKLRDEK